MSQSTLKSIFFYHDRIINYFFNIVNEYRLEGLKNYPAQISVLLFEFIADKFKYV